MQFIFLVREDRLAISDVQLKPSCRLAFSNVWFKPSCRLAFSNAYGSSRAAGWHFLNRTQRKNR
jgi:hypothetical protein